MNSYRTHTCGQLRPEDKGRPAVLAGWIDTIRDHGGVLFLDLRDQYGVTQVVLHDESLLQKAPRESVIRAEGLVRLRDPETRNPKIATGEVELAAEKLTVLSRCARALPFEIGESQSTREELRLAYRYLDLRNPKLRDNILLRAELIRFLRAEMQELGFTEFQTPILTASSPEGARDYLVPSRKHKGKFYALPQAPQQFKQLLMASGFDRYFQIAPCFRDEDARADRSPGEFYQLDFEMAFAEQGDVLDVAERVLYRTFSHFSEKPVSKPPFRRLTYAESMLNYGTDKPDLRNPLIIQDLTAFFADVGFKPFLGVPVRGIAAAGAAEQPRSFFERMAAFALDIGMKGLGYISVAEDGGLRGPIVKFLPEEKQGELRRLCALKPGDTVFFIADKPGAADRLAGQIRTELGARLGLIDTERYEFCFIVDFPMYGMNEDTGEIEFVHNPFSMPQGGMEALETKDPLDILAWQYDIVCNGVELSSGAVRNHLPELMLKAFSIAGYTEQDVKTKFSALYQAFHYGAPPHAGMAPGVDRMLMLLTGESSIREVVAFPMNQSAQDLLMGAPGEVTEQQLREAHIKIR